MRLPLRAQLDDAPYELGIVVFVNEIDEDRPVFVVWDQAPGTAIPYRTRGKVCAFALELSVWALRGHLRCLLRPHPLERSQCIVHVVHTHYAG